MTNANPMQRFHEHREAVKRRFLALGTTYTTGIEFIMIESDAKPA